MFIELTEDNLQQYLTDNAKVMVQYGAGWCGNCKITKPKIVMETGVAYGLSTMYILQALFENKKGILYSIDSVFSPWQSKEIIGSAIPSYLCKNWKLILVRRQKNSRKHYLLWVLWIYFFMTAYIRTKICNLNLKPHGLL